MVGTVKIFFLTKINFWESTNTGGKMISKRNFELLQECYGKENVYYWGIDETAEKDLKVNENVIIKGIRKNDWIRYYNNLHGRSGYSGKLERELLSCMSKLKPDIVFFDGTWHGKLLDAIQSANKKKIKSIAFYHNIEANVYKKNIKSLRKYKPQRIIIYFSVRRNEKYITQNADYRICLNERDATNLLNEYGKKADYLLPSTIKDVLCGEDGRMDEAKTRCLLFVGIYFPPNIHGIKWFVENVMPYIDAHLLIIGKDMDKLRKEVEGEKVTVIGEVKELKKYYMDADAVISPIFKGDGMKTKTAEALMYGKVQFATDEALMGYDVSGLDHIYRCNTKEDFIKSITLFLSMERRFKMDLNIRKVFLEKYEARTSYNRFIDFLNKENLM